MDVKELSKQYFDVWNAHNVAGIQAKHAAQSRLTDWDGTHGPTAGVVAQGIAGIWKAVPNIRIEIKSVFTSAASLTCVTNIDVIVDETTRLNVCDVIEYDEAGLVVSLNAYLAK